ncbi:MAG: hypothetical protein J6U54_12685 [Clostridiales bacterium]|nr:hypothetical protein [Clostridiales bacterium]
MGDNKKKGYYNPKPSIINIGRGQVMRGNLATLAGVDENDFIESEYYKCLAETWQRTVERMDSIAKENDAE